ncbi:MAG: vitamin K epoxide reductase family protein, partial [Verrucomicrobiales bacterium]
MYLRSGQASQQVPGWRLVLARLCLAGAVVISMYLSWSSLRSQAVAGCGAEGGCEGVLASRWSEVAGMPVGLIGALLYSVLLLGTLLPRPRTMANFVHAAASLLVIFGALWFVALQLFVVKQFCPWCCATHALAVLGVAFAWRKGEVWRGDVVGYPRVFLPLGLALTMAVLQSMSRPKERIVQSELETGAVSRDEETLYLYGGKVRLKLDQLPSRGRAEAPVIAVLLSDFTCPHCLELQRRLRDYEEETGGADLRVLHLPGYQEPLAREIHRLLLVAWRVDPALYQEATGAILSGELPVVYAEIEDFLKAKYADR